VAVKNMYLKKLELNGFKSFAQPSILEFSSGITAIVGPNGSGKSNIADAVRWILGEQSMKNIRSHSNRDLIFSGSKSRSRLGKANVSLYFDNQSGCIPLDYSEVVISRNIFRDGTSEYFINENLTKLMNVVETLAKANVGHRGFSVINQGMESEILRYNSSELYELLEEASGVRYLQLRKRRSGRQLKSTQTNLEKISGILIELIPHLRYLKREATKAERREKLEKKLEKIQKQFFFLRLIDLENQEKKLIKEKESLDLKIFQLKKEVSCLEEELKEEEVAIKQGSEKFINAQKELEKILDERVKLGEQLANLKAQIQLEKGKQPVEENREISIGYIYSALKNLLKFENLNEIKNKISLILERIEKNIENPKLSEKNKQINAGQLDKLLGEQKDLEEVLTEINQKYEAQKTILRSGQKELGQENFFNVERTLRRKRDALNEKTDLKN